MVRVDWKTLYRILFPMWRHSFLYWKNMQSPTPFLFRKLLISNRRILDCIFMYYTRYMVYI